MNVNRRRKELSHAVYGPTSNPLASCAKELQRRLIGEGKITMQSLSFEEARVSVRHRLATRAPLSPRHGRQSDDDPLDYSEWCGARSRYRQADLLGQKFRHHLRHRTGDHDAQWRVAETPCAAAALTTRGRHLLLSELQLRHAWAVSLRPRHAVFVQRFPPISGSARLTRLALVRGGSFGRGPLRLSLHRSRSGERRMPHLCQASEGSQYLGLSTTFHGEAARLYRGQAVDRLRSVHLQHPRTYDAGLPCRMTRKPRPRHNFLSNRSETQP